MLITELERFIQEDIGDDDTSCTIVPDEWVHASVITKENGVLAGLEEAIWIFDYFALEIHSDLNDGDTITAGDVVCNIWGRAGDMLHSERLARNFLCRMSGIATLTARCVADSGSVRVACTISGKRTTNISVIMNFVMPIS